MKAYPTGAAGTLLAEAWARICIASAYLKKTIQAILRHANVSTTATYYIKMAAADTQAAMAKFETELIGQRTGNDGETRSESLDLETTPN